MKTKVTHIGIYTPDLERLKDFYIKSFDAKCNDKYVNSKGFSSYFLTFDSDVRVEIMANTKLEYHKFVDLESGMNHLAFSVGTKENVIALTKQLEDDGYEIVSQPRTTGDGYFESKISDPDGNSIEITE